MSWNAFMKGTVGRYLPTQNPDNTEADIRLSRYGAIRVENPLQTTHGLSDEGSYFVGTNPTPGTAFAHTVSAAFSDTVPMLYMFNQMDKSDPNSKSIFLHYLKLIVTVAAASGVQAHYAAVLDSVARGLTTDNTTLVTPVSPHGVISLASAILLKAQNSATASALAASSQNKRIVGRGSFAGGVTIVGDELVVIFGATDAGAHPGLTAAQAVAAGRKVTNGPPIIVPPGFSLALHTWFPSNAVTGLSYELELGGWLK